MSIVRLFYAILVDMEMCSAAHSTTAVKLFYKNNDSPSAARRAFRRHYNLGRHDAVPSAYSINTRVRNFEETASAQKKKLP